MDNVALIIFLLSPILLVLGLIKPALFNRIKSGVSRKQLSLFFIFLTIASFTTFGVTAKPTAKQVKETAPTVEEQAPIQEQVLGLAAAEESQEDNITINTPSPSPTKAPSPTPTNVPSKPAIILSPIPTKVPSPKPTSVPTLQNTQPVVATTGNCSPTYPTVCIPPAPPDLDCKDISYRRFKVLPPDPHGFDGKDNDGIGCES